MQDTKSQIMASLHKWKIGIQIQAATVTEHESSEISLI